MTDELAHAYVSVAVLARRYYHALDAGDADRWVDTFAASGELVLTGRPAIVGHSGLRGYWSGRPQGQGARKHVTTDIDILATGERRVEATTEILTLDLTTGETLAIGSTEDLLCFDDDAGWRYARKIVRLAYRHPRL